MEQYLKKIIDRKLAKVPNHINKQWFYDFFELFLKYGYQGDITKAVDAMFNTEEIVRLVEDPPRMLLNTATAQRSMTQLMIYLHKKLDTLPDGEVQEFFDDMVNFFEENVDVDISSSTTFVKYVSLKYSNDIEVHVQNVKKFEEDPETHHLHINAKLGNFVLTSLRAHKEHNKNRLRFDHLKTISGVERQHLAYMTMQQFFVFLTKYFPHLDVCGLGVSRSNVVAQNFYARLGGVFFTGDTKQPIPLDKIKSSEYISCGVYFDREQIKRLADAEFVRALCIEEYRCSEHEYAHKQAHMKNSQKKRKRLEHEQHMLHHQRSL